jgi:pyruvate,water dikinase
MSVPHLLELDQIDRSDAPVVGAKAATLGWLRRHQLPVPLAFVIPATVFDQFVDEHGLAERLCSVERHVRCGSIDSSSLAEIEQLQAALRAGPGNPGLRRDVESAYAALARDSKAVVVRSSAIDEDLSEASFAGQHATVVDVRSADELWKAIGDVWASLFSEPAMRYRARRSPIDAVPSIALIVQRQIDCDVSGTLFTIDPVGACDAVVIEGSWGLGEAIARGEVTPDRYRIDRDTLGFAAPPLVADKAWQRVADAGQGGRLSAVSGDRRRRPALDARELAELTLLGLKIEELASAPQDVEWGLANGQWWLFQARPITTRPQAAPVENADESTEWTSGFLDERLVEPVSPLGWSVLRNGLEDLAFRDPLRMLGVDPLEFEPITRLWNGHPYARVAAFEALYKLFPDWLLPRDARRFFPGGDVCRRHKASRPRSRVAPEVLGALLRAVARDPLAISPFHNPATWECFEQRYRRALGELAGRVDRLDAAPIVDLPAVVETIDAVERENRRLLAIHRWSLTLAEVSYSLLLRLARVLFGPDQAPTFCALVVADLGDRSIRMNRALAKLRGLAHAGRDDDLRCELAAFLEEYGHRSFSLDLIRPNFAADPAQVIALVRESAEAARNGSGVVYPIVERQGKPGDGADTQVRPYPLTGGRGQDAGLRANNDLQVGADTQVRPLGNLPDGPMLQTDGWRARLLRPLIVLTRRHAKLREDQRFAWQRGLALLRRLYLLAGRGMVQRNLLDRPDDVFFLNADEVRAAAIGIVPSLRQRAATRARRYAEYRERFERRSSESYPPFLRGDRPLAADCTTARDEPGAISTPCSDVAKTEAGREALHGEPVSPGTGQGRARIVLRPEDLAAVRIGEVLVARGADPGWTTVFDRLAAIVSESGGQLSHASVVAREYRLPAVVAVPGATQLIRTGDELLVDGSTGVVSRLGRAGTRQSDRRKSGLRDQNRPSP